MPINNPSGRIDRSRNRRATPEYDRQRDSYNATLQASIERREKRRREEEEAKRRAELQAQQDAAQMARDRQQQKYGQADTAQRAYYAANEAADDFNRTKQLNRQQQKDVRRRDTLNNDFTLTRDREQARDQQDRDQLQFGFDTRQNEQKFGYQMMENDQQFGHQIQRDRFQHGNTMERDSVQFGYDTSRANQQHGNTMQRDSALNEFDTQRDVRQNQYQSQRDNRLNMFDVNREARQQQYTQQNAYQRETAEVSARWQENIQKARNAGMDFSAAQQQEMTKLDETFRKNVLNSPVDYDEGLKQRAMLEHQKKLAAIIPNEKVKSPQDMYKQARIFDEELGMYFLHGQDAKGNSTFEPIGGMNDGIAEQQRMQQMQQEKERQVAEKQADAQRKAMLERQREFMSIVNDKMNEESDLGGRVYPDRNAAIEAAKVDYAPMEELWRQSHGLPPMYELPSETKSIVNPPQAGNGNPWRKQPQGMADSLAARSGDPRMSEKPKPPVISHNSPLPSQVSDSLRTIPGGNQLQAIRDKYKSNTPEDQTVRLATTIVINAIMTKDTSDPDYEQALKILKGAGYNIGQ